MYSTLYCWLFTLVVCLTGVYSGDDFEKCIKMVKWVKDSKNFTCCKEDPIRYENDDSKQMNNEELEKYKECSEFPEDSDECSEKKQCFAKKMGVVDDKGEIDKSGVKEFMEKKLKPVLDPKVFEGMKKECYDGDLSKYKTDDTCSFQTLENCMGMQLIMGCVKWSDENSCKEMKDTASECQKMISK